MQKIIVLIAFVTLGGCAATAHNVETDHRTWTPVECSGFAGWDACKQQAIDACPRGFDVANQKEDLVLQARILQYACK